MSCLEQREGGAKGVTGGRLQFAGFKKNQDLLRTLRYNVYFICLRHGTSIPKYDALIIWADVGRHFQRNASFSSF